ncbi:MAG: starch-binding protein [Ruminococcus sp.]|nr:starch-binding protein [Ruminococcus sp.]
MRKRIISVVLAVCLLATCFVCAQYTATAVTTDKKSTSANPYGLAESLDDATILQAWNWSYTNIESKLEKIAKAGFTTIQISPPNEIKEATLGHTVNSESNNGWWMFYQPAGFQLNESTDNALGTKSQLVSMINKAHEIGLKVIADSVINHMGTCDNENNVTSTDPMKHVTPKAQKFEPEIYNNQLFHNPWENMTYAFEWNGPEDTCTYDLTRRCTSRLPDLKTEDPRVQNAIYEYLQEMVDIGMDGFRFDAAKHIETPNDLPKYRSDFWPNTVNKVKTYAKSKYNKELMSYGEILNTCGYNRKFSDYYPYMKVTDSTIDRQILPAVISGNASNAIPMNMANGTKAQTVLWNESHDTYMDGETRDKSKAQRNKAWAAIAARDGITALYLARPASLSQQLGVASETDWISTEVAEVNKFSNIFEGQSEYLQSSSNIAVIGRGSASSGGGAVLINCSSGTSANVSSVAVATLANGTYTDRISGGIFTVNNGRVSGSIGNTGIAVLYDEPGPTVYATASQKYYTDTISITLSSKNCDRATYSVNGSAETAFTSGQTVTLGTSADTAGATYKVTLNGYENGAVATTATYTYTKAIKPTSYNVTVKTDNVSGWSSTPNIYMWNESTKQNGGDWPGTPMSGSGGVYTATVSSEYDRIIFNCGSKQTVDIVIDCSTEYTISSETENNSGGTPCNKVNAKPEEDPTPTYYPGIGDMPTTAPQTTTAPVIPSTTVGDTTTAPTSTTQQTTTIQSQYSAGDVNRDNSVNISDVTLIQKYLVDLIAFDNEQKALADYDGDGRQSIKDATKIQYAIAKIA